MNAIADLVIPREVLQSVRMSPEELAVEIATHLYATNRLTMGRAKRLAGLDQISFQKELAKRNIYIHYTFEDAMKDARTLRSKLK